MILSKLNTSFVLKKLFLFLYIPFILYACTNNKKETSKSDYQIRKEKEQLTDSLNIENSKKLIQKYKSINGWDTIYRFTYSLQDLFKSDSSTAAIFGRIVDVFNNKNTFIVKVLPTTTSLRYFTLINVNFSQFEKMKVKINEEETNEGCFIVKVNKINSSQPTLKCEVGSTGDYPYSDLVYDFERIITIESDLIDFYLFER